MPATWPAINIDTAKRFINGDEGAFKTIYQAFVQALLAYSTNICGSREQAEDIVQDVFVICWEKKEQIRTDAIGNWLVKVTRNLSVKAFRRNVLIAQYVVENNSQSAEEITQHATVDSTRELRAMEIVNTLPPARKKIFLLSRIEQKSYQQIADELGISIRTVENQLSAALKQIRHQLNTPEIIFLLAIVHASI